MQTCAAAIEGYEAKLKALPLPRTPEAGGRHMAALIALLPGVTKPAAQLEAEVQLIAPPLFGVFIELAALAFGFFGFRPARAPAAPVRRAVLETVSPQQPASVTVPALATTAKVEPADVAPVDDTPEAITTARRKLTKPEAEARVVELRRPVSQDALARRWGVTEAAISQWVGDWETRGIVTRFRQGRCKLVQSAPRQIQVVRAA